MVSGFWIVVGCGGVSGHGERSGIGHLGKRVEKKEVGYGNETKAKAVAAGTAKPRCIYCPPQKWERIKRRAKRFRMTVSRLGRLCCERAVVEETVSHPKVTGHRLVLGARDQQEMHGNAKFASEEGRVVIRGPGGAKAVVTVAEIVRFLRLSEGKDKGEEGAKRKAVE